ncbi:DNA endonuclease [Vibrio phage VAP7]|uniref:DNA endonuclease n=1 Tax=Vibrio phage VAP7 TaxID=2584487 RepID=A0A4Y5TXI6_9CAUD|nr:DNA endonuclease [Vibrio phage VAP7]QDB73356.1 DNA endonuclease [Vibrio phage VAP7]
MKLLRIGDLHVGARSGNEFMREFIKDYLMNHVLEYMIQNGIKHAIQAGDWMDIRRSLPGRDRQWIVDEFVPKLVEHGLEFWAIPGNHDLTNRNTIEPNWIQWLEQEGQGQIHYIGHAQDVMIEDHLVCMVPWICRENYDSTLEHLKQSKAKHCVGHFELAGFNMYQGSTCEDGQISTSLLQKFELVDSGHFHTRSKQGNIGYLGTPYHINWQDFLDGDNRGFDILDTETMESKFIRNKVSQTLFRTFDYDWSLIADDKESQKQLTDTKWLEDEFGLKGQIIRVTCINRENATHYKKFVAAMRNVECLNQQIIDKSVNIVTDEVVVDEDELKKDTLSVIKEKVNSTEGIDQKAVSSILEASYLRCQNTDNITA